MLDLEDAVAPDDKPQARRNVIAALNELDWSGCTVTVSDQRAGHPLLLPRHRRRRRAERRWLDTDPHPKGRFGW
jgi:hypothetical protein